MIDLQNITNLVGEITAQDLKYVDCYITKELGIFIPGVGYCGYAIKHGHTHPAYSVVILLKESENVFKAESEPDNRHYLAGILSPDVPHEEKDTGEFSRYIALFISKQLFDKTLKFYNRSSLDYKDWFQFLISKEIVILINRFTEEYDRRQSGYENILEALAIIITHDIIRNVIGKVRSDSVVWNNDIQGVIDYIHQNFHEPLSVSKLSGMANMSVSNFTGKFKEQTGLSPNRYIIQTRLKKSKILLRSNTLNITEIALQCGFSNTAHLTLVFKKHFNMTPSEYKELYKTEN